MEYLPGGTLNDLCQATDRLRAALEDRDGDLYALVGMLEAHARQVVAEVDAYVHYTHGQDTQDVRIETALEAIQRSAAKAQKDQPDPPAFPGVAWWGRNVSAGVCQGCQQAKSVHAGYNGGAPTGVVACAACIAAAR